MDKPHRLHGLPPADRRAYELIVEGGVDMLRWAADGPKNPKGRLAARARAGNEFLEKMKLGGPHPTSGRSSIVLLPAADARHLTLVFAGNGRQFVLPVELALRQDTHLLLIRDPRRCFSLAHIHGLGATYEDCLAALCRISDALQPQNLYVVGVSAGASGGLRFACDMGASGFLGFSVPTTLDLLDDTGAELRHYPQLTLLYRHNRAMGIDLAKYYAHTWPRPRAMLVFGDGHVRDSWLARRMEHIDGVEVFPTLGFNGHDTYQHTVKVRPEPLVLERLYELTPLQAPTHRRSLATA